MNSKIRHVDARKRRKNRKERIMQSLKNQLKDVDLWRATSAEFLATFIFVFILCVTHMVPHSSWQDTPETTKDSNTSNKQKFVQKDSLQISIGVALAYATLLQCFENISGGHMNPAISVAMVIAGHINLLKAFLYIIAQIAGAFSAVALCFGIFPSDSAQQSTVNQLNKNLTSLQGFGLELLQTLIVTVTWLATYATSKSQLGSSALPVGMAYLANSLWAGQLTGASTNPARSLAPAVLSDQWTDIWVYTAGPISGCTIGAFLYCQVFATSPRKKSYKKVTGQGCDVEGTSFQGEHETTRMLPYKCSSNNLETTNLSSTKNVSVPKQMMHQGNSQQNLSLLQSKKHLSSSRTQQHAPIFASSEDLEDLRNSQNRSMHELTTAPLNDTHRCAPSILLKDTIAKRKSQVLPRPNTACGSLSSSKRRTNGSVDALSSARSLSGTPSIVFRSSSVNEPLSQSYRVLTDN